MPVQWLGWQPQGSQRQQPDLAGSAAMGLQLAQRDKERTQQQGQFAAGQAQDESMRKRKEELALLSILLDQGFLDKLSPELRSQAGQLAQEMFPDLGGQIQQLIGGYQPEPEKPEKLDLDAEWWKEEQAFAGQGRIDSALRRLAPEGADIPSIAEQEAPPILQMLRRKAGVEEPEPKAGPTSVLERAMGAEQEGKPWPGDYREAALRSPYVMGVERGQAAIEVDRLRGVRPSDLQQRLDDAREDFALTMRGTHPLYNKKTIADARAELSHIQKEVDDEWARRADKEKVSDLDEVTALVKALQEDEDEKILVRRKSDGQIGRMSERFFDPALYEKVE